MKNTKAKTNFEKWKEEMTPSEFSNWMHDLLNSWPRESVVKFANSPAKKG